MAWARPADAALVLCDADDDCAVTWATSANHIIRTRWAGAAVTAIREYEAWLLASSLGAAQHDGKPVEGIRDAKAPLQRLHPGYLPTAHQLKLTRNIDVASLRVHSRSFDKLVRALAAIFGVLDPGDRAPRLLLRAQTRKTRR